MLEQVSVARQVSSDEESESSLFDAGNDEMSLSAAPRRLRKPRKDLSGHTRRAF